MADEYIEKTKLLEQIDKDSAGNEGQYGDEWAFTDTISDMPTIDIVRCKDCRYFRKGWTKCKMLNLNGADGDWFCADGERRTENE